jgi:hypothetical protein
LALPLFVVSFFLWIAKKITGKIFFPEDQKELIKRDNQKYFFERNMFIINVNGKYGLADVNNPPPELLNLLKNALNDSPLSSKPHAQIINASFYEEVYSLTEFFKSGNLPLEKVRSYLSEEFESVLILSEYARKLFELANHAKAQQTKSSIYMEYGARGRKLCNLYLRGYINKVIEEYAYNWIDSKDLGENDKKSKINSLIEEVLKNSDSVFFICGRHQDNSQFLEIIDKKMSTKSEFIALHAGGKKNISILKQILENIEKNSEFYRYHLKKNEYFDEKAKINLFDVYLRIVDK